MIVMGFGDTMILGVVLFHITLGKDYKIVKTAMETVRRAGWTINEFLKRSNN
jgi:hypothetical protein